MVNGCVLCVKKLLRGCSLVEIEIAFDEEQNTSCICHVGSKSYSAVRFDDEAFFPSKKW